MCCPWPPRRAQKQLQGFELQVKGGAKQHMAPTQGKQRFFYGLVNDSPRFEPRLKGGSKRGSAPRARKTTFFKDLEPQLKQIEPRLKGGSMAK